MKNNLVSKVLTAAVSITTVVSLSGASALMPAVAHGATLEELMAQIAALQAQLVALQGASSSSSASSAASSALLSSGNLTLGSTGAAVMELQKFLNANGAQVAASGAGSPGSESSYFGSLTRAALAKWQAANGVSPAVGYFGPITRAKMATVSSSAPAAGGSPATPAAPAPAGTGLTVRLASDQPAASLAPASAARIPFTKVQLTASADGDITVTGLVIERTGLAQDSALSAILMLDENGAQIGLKKTLNSEHRATVGESMTIKAGTTRTLTIAGNRAAAGSLGGQTLALSVVGANTSANVNATYPLMGTTHTVNETLSIGTVSLARGPLDPGSSATKEIGTTGYTFSSIKVTAGSTEKVYLKSIRWNQTGSASASDLSNVKTWVDGTSYDATVSADGKYYTSTFPSNGLLMDKGFSKEFSIKGDVTGGSSRTIDFDIAKLTDLSVSGQTYGYGIVPPQTGASDPTDDSAAFSNTEDPWYDAAQVLVSSGTMSVSTWTGVQAQNISINLADQPIGGWTVDVKGESISVASMKFNFNAPGEAISQLTNIKLLDGSGKVLAGPIDGSGSSQTATLTFTDTVTFPVGVTNLKMVGKLSTDFENNDTVLASTTPNGQWTTVTGQTTGNSITPTPASALTGQTMTVKAAALTISVSSVPIAQTVIAGVNQFEFARYILDASGSGEDLRLTSLPLEYNVPSGSASDLQNCKLYDGSTVLNASDVKNPSAAASSTAFTFDGSGLTLAKGASKQLALKCDLKASATGSYAWGYDSSSSPTPTGQISGQDATLTENDSAGQTMTAATSGTLAVSLDSASPAYAIASPGQTIELSRIKFSATNEDVTLKQMALQLTQAASNTPIDLVGQMVTIHTTDGTKVGEATFASGDNATSSAMSVTVPKDGSKVLVIKGTLAAISASGPATRSGDIISVDYDGDNEGLNGNYGTGASSGSTVTPSADDTASSGARVMKAYPTVEQVALSSSERTLVSGDAKTLYKFKVTANNGDVAMYKWSFSISSSTASGSNATTTKFGLYAFTDSGMSSPDANYNGTNNPGGLVNSGFCFSGLAPQTSGLALPGNLGAGSALVEIYPDQTSCNNGTTTLIVPSGATRWFKLVSSIGTLAPSGTSENLQVQLEGDAAFPVNSANLMQQASGIDGDANDDFVWSPVSTSTSNASSDLDWTNGYGVTGLPSSNMTSETISK